MGLNIDAARFLLAEKKRGIQFGRTVTLGQQGVYMETRDYAEVVRAVGGVVNNAKYAGDFLEGLGASPLIAMDFSDYEGAEIIHDANEPVAAELRGSFDTLIDGGTLEHVFNFPVAIKNCMDLVKVGGRVILLTPWHNFSGHGFYEFSPELLWNVFSFENGFEVERMMFVAEGHWYEVKSPAIIQRRIEIRTEDEILSFMTARKTADIAVFTQWPQQSDYHAAWERGSYSTAAPHRSPALKKFLLEKIPALAHLQQKRRQARKVKALRPSNNPGFMKICPAGFVPSSPPVKLF